MKKSFKTIVILGTLSLLLSSCSVIVSSSSSSSSSSSKESKPETFTITWKNYDGSILEVDEEVSEDAVPTFDGLDPIREETAQFSYIWTGWTPEISPVTADATYVAVFREEIKKYTITWKNDGGEVLDVEEYPYGVMPEYKGEEPEKDDTIEHTFDFDGWSPTISEVVGNAEYTACFEENLRQYNITWKNDDGTILRTDRVDYGKTPSFDGEVPIKESTAQYSYIFNDWFPSVSPVDGDAEYTATYNSEIRNYTVTWKNDDGSILEVDKNVPYGSTPSYDGSTPVKTKRGFEYTFDKWSPSVDYVIDDVTYIAEYKEKAVFSFETINYEMREGYKLSDINGAPWINSNIYGELEKIKKPSLNDDFYASVNYESFLNGDKGAFDRCDQEVSNAFNSIYNGTASETTNGEMITTAYNKIVNGSANQVSNYLNNIDLTTYLTTKESFASKSSMLNLVPLDEGYEVEFNDGYFRANFQQDFSNLPFLWVFDDLASHAKSILSTLSSNLNLGFTSQDLENIKSTEYDIFYSAYSDYYRYDFSTTKYTVSSIPWAPLKSALLDLGFENDTTIRVKRMYKGSFNTIYNTMYSNQKSLLKKMIVSRLAFDCRFFVGASIYKQVNQYISEMASYFENEAYLYWMSDNEIARRLSTICFPNLTEQTYIELQGSEETKAAVSQLIDDVLDAYKELADDSWLGEQTKAKMKTKLEYMKYTSCYSDVYKNISKINEENISSKTAFQLYRLYENAMVDEAIRNNVDTSGDFNYMHSWTTNAFYSPYGNSFVILNGLAKGMLGETIEEKYGMLGMVIGHEITHAFDSSGSQFDENGEQKNWWTDIDKAQFNSKVNKLKRFYNQISLKKDFNCDGDLVNGEATADLGGMKVALMLAKKVDDFDYDAFFRAYANLWLTSRMNINDVQSRASDSHPFNYLRVNVVVSQFDEFVDTYDIKPGDGMYVPEEQRIKVW